MLQKVDEENETYSNLNEMVKKWEGKIDGPGQATELLRGLDRDHQERLLSSIAAENPELAERLRKSLFSFDDVLALSDSDFQAAIAKHPRKRLALCLRGAEAETLKKFQKNLSSRAYQDLLEEIEAIGPQRKSDVESARQEWAKIVEQMLSKS